MLSTPPDFVTEALKLHSLEPLEADDTDIIFYHTIHDELCYFENLRSYLERAACTPKLLNGSAAAHLEGSREYFGLVMREQEDGV